VSMCTCQVPTLTHIMMCVMLDRRQTDLVYDPAQRRRRRMMATVDTAFQRFVARFRRAVRAFESERTEKRSVWEFRCELSRDEIDDYWIAECLDLPGCISQGKTKDEAMSNLIDAMGEVLSARMHEQAPQSTGADEFKIGIAV
jgi:predicted RNase H-like HicB family nuclease